MKNIKRYRKLGGVPFLLILLMSQSLIIAAEFGKLRCEYTENPLGIESAQPRLGWVINSDARGDRQVAYQILVASSTELLAQDKGDLWDSGKVISEQSNHVIYQGTPLSSSRQVFWKVRSWLNDKKGEHPVAWSKPATWTMGLMKSEDWKSAWIQWLPPVVKYNEYFIFLLSEEKLQPISQVVLHNAESGGGIFQGFFRPSFHH